MKQEQAIQALENLVKQKRIARNSLVYKTAKAAIEAPGVYQICGAASGTGRFSTSKSWQNETAEVLKEIGVLFVKDNIAKRGGKAGDTIEVLPFNN